MAALHPHWRATDCEEQPTKAPGLPQMADLSAIQNQGGVSRRPAAIVGILIVCATGFAFFHGLSGILGQVSDDGIVITITKDGVDPSEVNGEPGQKITWKNMDDIPHIIASSTLPTDTGQPMQTSPIFKGNSASVTIPSDAAEGT